MKYYEMKILNNRSVCMINYLVIMQFDENLKEKKIVSKNER